MSYRLSLDGSRLNLYNENSKIIGFYSISQIDSETIDNVSMMQPSHSPIDLNFCQIFHPNTSISSLLGQHFSQSGNISNVLDNITFLPTGGPCRTMPLLYGSPIISIWGSQSLTLLAQAEDDNLRIQDGFLVQAHYTDKMLSNTTIYDCCTLTNPISCPSYLTTQNSICNITMESYCKDKPDSEACFRWLINSEIRNDTRAYKVYSELCSEDMNNYYCSLLCHLTREKKLTNLSSYCDVALTTYCQNNKTDKKCLCSFGPKITSSTLQSPRVCWDINCSNDAKWLLFEDLLVKRNCKLLSCDVTLNNIDIGEEVKINVENSCIAGNKISTKDVRKGDETIPVMTVPMFLDWKLFIFSILFIVILIFVLRRFIKKPELPKMAIKPKKT